MAGRAQPGHYRSHEIQCIKLGGFSRKRTLEATLLATPQLSQNRPTILKILRNCKLSEPELRSKLALLLDLAG